MQERKSRPRKQSDEFLRTRCHKRRCASLGSSGCTMPYSTCARRRTVSDTMINRNSAVSNIAIHAHAAVRELDSSTGDADPVGVADQILRKFGPRAITMLTSGRVAAEGRALPARLSANDCYVALDEACRKMARVAIRKFRQDYAPHGREIDESLQEIFPDPAAYLARAIKSVIADEGRLVRREVPA